MKLKTRVFKRILDNIDLEEMIAILIAEREHFCIGSGMLNVEGKSVQTTVLIYQDDHYHFELFGSSLVNIMEKGL